MALLDLLKNVLQQPERPAGDPVLFAKIRDEEYRKLFNGNPVRVIPHGTFGKPGFGGRIDVRLYDVTFPDGIGDVQIAVTSGLSDYAMKLPGPNTGFVRRELIQYFRECRARDIARLHDMAWLPIVGHYCLDFFHTTGPHPIELPGSMFLAPLVKAHRDFTMMLAGDETQFLWHVPLTHKELDYKAEHGADALVQLLEENELPWIFEAGKRFSLV